MNVSKETRISNIVCVIFVLFAGVIRLVAKPVRIFSYNSIIFVLFSAAASLWICGLHKRLLQTEVRRSLIGAALLMIFWMAIRTVKYDLLPSGHFMARYAWYMYYIPMLLIPLLMFLSVLSIGKSHDRNINRFWYLLFIPAFAILSGILTNDLHQAAFLFPDGLSGWNDYNIIRGPVYYMAVAWMAALFIAMLSVVISRCSVPENRKMIWVPMLPLILGAVYVIFNIFEKNNLLTEMLRAPEIGCFVFAAFIECLICVHLFPNNDNYGAFWNASSIGAGIMDKKGNIRYKSVGSIPVTLEQVRKAQNDPVYPKDSNFRLKSHQIYGGFGYWIRDISEINVLNEKLYESGNIAEEENAVLEAENKIREERLRIEEQKRLYDDMSKGVCRQLDELNEFLASPPVNEGEFEKKVKYACVLTAYIKRRSNLLLLSNQSGVIHSEELRYAVIESLEYIQLCGIKAKCFSDGKENLPCRLVILAYEIFEAVLEDSVYGADNILTYLNIEKNRFTLRMEINAPGKFFSGVSVREKVSSLGGILEIEKEDSTEFVTLTLPTGGESI